MSEKLFLDMLNECLKVDESKVDEVKINEGQFSWLTGDTDQPIYSTEGHQQPVWMLDDKGNQWEESNYEGYGVFGGKDFYELLAEMNGLGLDRDAGMDLAYKDNRTGENTPGVKYPRFVSDPKIKYEEVFNPMQHDNQGWFMEDDIDESKVNEKEEPEDIFMEPEEEDDLSPDPDDIEPKEEEAALEIEKEYLGKTEDTHFYILFSEDDIQILDQLGEKKYSAIDNNLDISDPNRFVVQAIQDVEIEQIERGIFMRYVLPLLLEEEPEEEQEEDLETAEGEEELEEIPSEKERPVESKKVVEKEMPTCKKCGKKHWPFEKCDKKDEKEEVDETEKVEEKSGGGTERNRYKLLFALPKNVKGKLIVKGQAASFKAFVEKHKDKLQGADLHGADLSGAELEGVDLRKADLSRADLSFADLSNGNLRFVNFLGANLGSANLSNTNMRAVRLSYAHLAAADLTGADLTGANLEGVDLSDANLEGVIGLEPGYVSRIKGQWADRKTKIDTMGKEVEESSDESSRGDHLRKKKADLQKQVDKLKKESEDIEKKIAEIDKEAKSYKGKVKEGYEEPGKRDGSGPYKDSARGSASDVGRRKQAGEECPYKDETPGGRADRNTPDDFPPDQMAIGIKVESEHTDDTNLAREIAMDHLKEDPEYYTKLNKMEASEGKECSDKDSEDSKIKKLIEMQVVDGEGNEFEVNLINSNTDDTVVEISGRSFAFDKDFASLWRNEEGVLSVEGLTELALDALANLEENEYNELISDETVRADAEETFDEEKPVEASPRESKVEEEIIEEEKVDEEIEEKEEEKVDEREGEVIVYTYVREEDRGRTDTRSDTITNQEDLDYFLRFLPDSAFKSESRWEEEGWFATEIEQGVVAVGRTPQLLSKAKVVAEKMWNEQEGEMWESKKEMKRLKDLFEKFDN